MRTLIGFALMGALSLPAIARADDPEEGTETKMDTESKAGCEPIRLHFEFDSAKIEDNQKPALDRTAQCLKEHENQRVSVEGNTDKIGSLEYNQALGARRAAAVGDYLKAQGVSPNQLQEVSFGKGNPVCPPNSDASCRQENRNTAIRPACKL